jgi:hypothetical protein
LFERPAGDVAIGQAEVAQGGAARWEAVRHDRVRDMVVPLQKFPQQLQRRLPVPLRLLEDVERLALVVHGAPQIDGLAADPEKDFVQMPEIRGPWPAPTDPVGVASAEFQHPSPDGLIGRVDPALGQHVLDISVAQSEAEVEPDGMLDDDRWEPIA